MELLTHNYGDVQKGKGICDRVCGMTKARMRSWIAAGDDLKNVIDVEEGTKYADGIKNTKVVVAEVIPDTGIQSFSPKNFVLEFYFQGHFDKANIANVSVLRSIRYGSNDVKVLEGSGVGTGISIPLQVTRFRDKLANYYYLFQNRRWDTVN